MAKLYFLVTFIAFVGCTLVSCAAPVFKYTNHSPPRVFVSHTPIHPSTEQEITITADAELNDGSSIREIVIVATAFIDGTSTPFEITCATTPCTLSIPRTNEAGNIIYSAKLVSSTGGKASSASAYLFQVGELSVQNIPLRVPIDLYQGRRKFNILLVRDDHATNYPTKRSAVSDVQNLIYNGALRDGIYRWRDNQLAFYLSNSGGTTTSYYSGQRMRCGQEPWANRTLSERAIAQTGLESMDVMMTIHKRSGPDWRDCAGLGNSIDTGIMGADIRSGSAYGLSAEVFAHELGHTLLGLSDEYTETTSSRQVPAGDPPANVIACMCCDPTMGDVGGGRPGTTCLPGQPSCSEALPEQCLSAGDACPRIGADCHGNENIFESLTACTNAKIKIDAHPGVEPEASSLNCRMLCEASRCPCEPIGSTRELWILDEQNPSTPVSASNDDVMGVIYPGAPEERHGPACGWCAETRFCLLWETGRGQTMAEAESTCLSP